MSLPIDGTLDLQNINKIINGPTPTAAGDLVPKSYVDAMAQGVIFLQAVQAASTGANVPVNNPGAALDGVNLTAGWRILLKDQTTASENGVWVWNGAAVALTRPNDFPHNGQAVPGTTVYVEQGTVNTGALFSIIGQANVTIDTNAQTWSQTNGANDITVQAPLTKTGNTISLNNGNPLPIANGGTGASTASGARTNLGVPSKFATTIGDGATTTFSVAHNLGTTDIHVQVYDMATGNRELVGHNIVDGNHVSVGPFGTAPAAAGGTIGSGTGKRVVVVG
jgi:hypothetical protein